MHLLFSQRQYRVPDGYPVFSNREPHPSRWGMGLELDKSGEAREELRRKGLDSLYPGATFGPARQGERRDVRILKLAPAKTTANAASNQRRMRE